MRKAQKYGRILLVILGFIVLTVPIVGAQVGEEEDLRPVKLVRTIDIYANHHPMEIVLDKESTKAYISHGNPAPAAITEVDLAKDAANILKEFTYLEEQADNFFLNDMIIYGDYLVGFKWPYVGFVHRETQELELLQYSGFLNKYGDIDRVPGTDYLLAANPNTNKVHVIDGKNKTRQEPLDIEINLGQYDIDNKGPREIVVVDNRRAYVSAGSHIAIINTEDFLLEDIEKISMVSNIKDMVYHDGFLYVLLTLYTEDTSVIRKIDIKELEILNGTELETYKDIHLWDTEVVHEFELSQSGKYIYVSKGTAFLIIDRRSGIQLAEIDLSDTAGGPLSEFEIGKDGKLVYLLHSNGISILDVSRYQ